MFAILSFAALLALSFGQDASYGHGSYGPGRNYYAEIAEARSRISALGDNDVIINTRLDGVRVKINLVSDFRAIFESTTLPEIEASMAAQDERIKSITEQLKDLCLLFDEVEALMTQVNNLVGDLKEIRETRVDKIEADLSRLENSDIDQNQYIDELEAQVEYQFKRLDEAEEKVSENEAFVERVYQATIEVVDIVNEERGEGCFTVALDPYNPTQYIEYSRPFPVTPSMAWGITEFSVKQGYEQEYEESIYTHVDVQSDQYGFNVTLVDNSKKWHVERVVAKITAFYVNNEILEIH